MKTYLLIAALFVWGLHSKLATAELSFHPTFSLGIENGGDRVFEQSVTSGGTRGFNAGGLVVLGMGADAEYLIHEAKLSTRFNFGFKGASAEAKDGKLDLFRWLIELSQHYELRRVPVIFGTGVAYHFSNHLNGTGVLASRAGRVDPSLGSFLQVDYAFRKSDGSRFYLGNRDYQLGLRFTFQKLKVTEAGTNYGANAIGVHLRHVW